MSMLSSVAAPILGRHIENVKQFGVPAVVAINHFISDTDAEIEAMKVFVESQGSEAIVCKHWALGSAGVEELANKVVELAEGGTSQFSPLYGDEMPLFEKIEAVAKRIYRASEVIADKSVRDQLKQWEQQGYGHLPVCMAKTQYSFSTDPNLRGAPNDHYGSCARGAAVGRGRVHRGDHRCDHDHAGPAESAVFGEDIPQRQRTDRRPVLDTLATTSSRPVNCLTGLFFAVRRTAGGVPLCFL